MLRLRANLEGNTCGAVPHEDNSGDVLVQDDSDTLELW